MNGLTNAELNEIVFTVDQDEIQTEFGVKKMIEMIDEYFKPKAFLKWAQTHREWKSCEKLVGVQKEE